mgnify:CR=1 FL=1
MTVDREIVGEEIGGGESEVDDPGYASIMEEYVVAKEIAVNRPLWGACPYRIRSEFDFAGEQSFCSSVRNGCTTRAI